MQINFDMDGTLVDFYGVDGWLDDLEHYNTRPYEIAKPLINLSTFARIINKRQREGDEINIISWSSKTATEEFNIRIIEAKKKWLHKHLPSVKFDGVYIVPYGTPKSEVIIKTKDSWLFDDEIANREEWGKRSCDAVDIISDLLSIDINEMAMWINDLED